MRSFWRWSGIIPLFLFAVSSNSCVTPPVETKPSVYYVTPVITYLKDCPAYDCKVVGELYHADRVERLEVKDNWWRVRLEKGTLTGWLPQELLSQAPVEAAYFYVAADSLELRDCPGPDCPFRKILLKGDRVQKIDENGQGWFRVLVEKDASIGWIPAAQVTDQAPKIAAKPAPEKEYYYAAAAAVNLYSLPLFSSKVVKTLPLNEKVEKLAQHGQDWFKVRHEASGAEGWVATRDLKSAPVEAAPPKPKRKFIRKKPAPKKPPGPEEAPEPEAM
jgi:uncharacterized protein YgiM (DUF1202 family)